MERGELGYFERGMMRLVRLGRAERGARVGLQRRCTAESETLGGYVMHQSHKSPAAEEYDGVLRRVEVKIRVKPFPFLSSRSMWTCRLMAICTGVGLEHANRHHDRYPTTNVTRSSKAPFLRYT